MGFEYQFFVKDIGLEFPTNLLISDKSSSKIFLAETEDTVSEFVFSSKTISFSFHEIVQASLSLTSSIYVDILSGIFISF